MVRLYGIAEHVIATWTVVIASAVAAAASRSLVVVFVVILRNGKCYALCK